MKRTIGGIFIICILLVAFIIVKPIVFDSDAEAGHSVMEPTILETDEPVAESVIASAVNPTKVPEESAGQPTVVPESAVATTEEPLPEITVAPTIKPVATPTAKPVATAQPTPTPKVVEIQEPTRVPVSVATPTPKPVETQVPEEENTVLSDEDIAYVAELLGVQEDKVREVIARAEEAGYTLDPDAILSGNFNVMEVWGIVTDVFGRKEATELLFKVMKLGFL